MRVRNKSFYYFYPVLMDRCSPCYGLSRGLVSEGDKVQVVNQHGCPPANTMGHCYIEKDGHFLGLVCTNSLSKEKRA